MDLIGVISYDTTVTSHPPKATDWVKRATVRDGNKSSNGRNCSKDKYSPVGLYRRNNNSHISLPNTMLETEQTWKNVIWSDETKMEHFAHGIRWYVW